MAEYGSAFLSQLFYIPWLSAAVLTLISLGIVGVFGAYVKALLNHKPLVWHFLPLAALLVYHQNYYHALVVDVSILLALGFALMHAHLRTRVWPAAYVLLGGAALYYISGNALFLAVIFVGITEMLSFRQFVLPFVYALAAGFYAWVSGSYLFLISPQHAFQFPLISGMGYRFPLVGLSGFFALFILLAALGAAILPQSSIFTKKAWIYAQALVVLCVSFGVPVLLYPKVEKTFFTFQYYSQTQQWDRILKLAQRPHSRTPEIQHYINRALCHTGKLGDSLFAYHQHFGRDGLVLNANYVPSTERIRSDLYWDWGAFNEAKHWAHEAASVRGETAWNLQRLALCYLVLEEKKAAHLYLNKLNQTLLFREWAEKYMPYVQPDADVRRHPYLQSLIDLKVEKNYLEFVNQPEKTLNALLQQNPQNRVACDYYMACLLLEKKIGSFVKECLRVQDFDEPLPRHYQEAILFYAAQRTQNKMDVSGYQDQIDAATLSRFKSFQQTFLKHRTNKASAKDALAHSHHDTYWYYLFFVEQPDR